MYARIRCHGYKHKTHPPVKRSGRTASFGSQSSMELYQFNDVELDYAYVDAMTVHLVKRPDFYDVIVAENLFGDIISDLGAATVGGMGVSPSAELGDRHGLFQGAHGSAPDIAGKGIANPLAQFMSFAMLLRYSFDQGAEADLLEAAVDKALQSTRTGDIMTPGCTETGTDGMTAAVLDAMDRLAR